MEGTDLGRVKPISRVKEICSKTTATLAQGGILSLSISKSNTDAFEHESERLAMEEREGRGWREKERPGRKNEGQE
jgi:hypothetical protein